MDDPNADTEWNDVLRAKGILPPKPKELEITEEELTAMLEEVQIKLTRFFCSGPIQICACFL